MEVTHDNEKLAVKEFVKAMQDRIKKYQSIKGDSWKTASIQHLMGRSTDNIDKYSFAPDPETILDSAAYAYMAWVKHHVDAHKLPEK